MTVAQLLQRLTIRVGSEVIQQYGEPTLLQIMNEIYHSRNRFVLEIERSWWASFADSDQVLKYDAQTGAFTVGLVVTGGTSGATGTIVEILDTDSVSGSLILSGVLLTFQNNEAITDTSTGAAVANEANASAGYIAHPADLIKPLSISPYRVFREPEVYDTLEDDTFTIFNRRLYVSNAANTARFNIAYYTKGLTLVRKIVDANTEIDAPEWPDDLHQYIFYALATHTSKSYSMYAEDILEMARLERQLKQVKWTKQEASPNTQGPKRRNAVREDIYRRQPNIIR